jgi:hypothetical protein
MVAGKTLGHNKEAKLERAFAFLLVYKESTEYKTGLASGVMLIPKVLLGTGRSRVSKVSGCHILNYHPCLTAPLLAPKQRSMKC